MESVAVIGGGSWATALVKIISENQVPIHWWFRHAADVQHVQSYRHNPRYLSGVTLDLTYVQPAAELVQVINAARWIMLAVPAAFLESVLQNLPAGIFNGKYLVSAIKGMIPVKNCLVTQYLQAYFQVPMAQQCVIAGPCHAEEVALEKQSYLTIGAADVDLAENCCQLLRNRYVRASPMDDIDGIEYGAVMKNIIALACGIAHGLNYGDNFQAVMVSNAMTEIEAFLQAINPRTRNLSASAYLGDLLVTAYSQFSRNRTFGNMIGRGYSVKSAQFEMNMVAEGYYAVKIIHDLNKKLQVPMPITEAAYNILYERISPPVEIAILKEKFK